MLLSFQENEMTRRDKLQEQAKWEFQNLAEWEFQNLGSETFSFDPSPS